jgi:hypothetical protein
MASETADLSEAEVLERAAALIARPNGWTKGAFSRDMFGTADAGNGRWASDPTCFCLRGALIAAAGMPMDAVEYMTKFPGEGFLEDALGGRGVIGWNDFDCTSQAEAVAALQRAAAMAKASGEQV